LAVELGVIEERANSDGLGVCTAPSSEWRRGHARSIQMVLSEPPQRVRAVGNVSPPARCFLCNSSDRIRTAGFRQLYSQGSAPPVSVHWWECQACAGWFAYPVPQPETIERYWSTVDWADPGLEEKIAENKRAMFASILAGLRSWTEPGPLLDVGCNFGRFMLAAQAVGWNPVGFDPSATAVEKARAKGFEVRSGWALEDAGFAEGSFAAITSIDVFYYAWHPRATLGLFYKLLRPGGVLAMRISNKRFILGLVRAFFPPSPRRDARLSRLLQGQFHTIGMSSLSRIARERGFDRVRVEPRAMAAPWAASSWRSRSAYLGTDIIHLVSLNAVNLSPAVLLFARKPTTA
jgi:SAM-dependent methyltransferase